MVLPITLIKYAQQDAEHQNKNSSTMIKVLRNKWPAAVPTSRLSNQASCRTDCDKVLLPQGYRTSQAAMINDHRAMVELRLRRKTRRNAEKPQFSVTSNPTNITAVTVD
jgi:hypothetical protein